jgi:hypothetical protein
MFFLFFYIKQSRRNYAVPKRFQSIVPRHNKLNSLVTCSITKVGDQSVEMGGGSGRKAAGKIMRC